MKTTDDAPDGFPLMLFKFPATKVNPQPLQDGVYDTLTVGADTDRAAAVADGWHESPAAARAAFEAAKAEQKGMDDAVDFANRIEAARALVASLPPESPPAAPTRAEMEQKAKELGIASKNVKDADLLAAINAKLSRG